MRDMNETPRAFFHVAPAISGNDKPRWGIWFVYLVFQGGALLALDFTIEPPRGRACERHLSR